jgi:hypothetical protein
MSNIAMLLEYAFIISDSTTAAYILDRNDLGQKIREILDAGGPTIS